MATAKKSGGSLKGMKASTKRVGPVDPKGAYTKVQEKTLAGSKGKASLTKDKQLGATKMKGGGSIPYPKGKTMSPADSASFRAGYGQPIPGDGYAGISSNPYFKKGQAAAKPKKTMKVGGMVKKCKYGCK